MDMDRLNKIAAGLQPIVTMIGFFVGGIWILFTFSYLGTAEKSRAELAEIDLRQRQIQEELAERQPNLSIEIDFELAGTGTVGTGFVSLQIKLRNDGKRPVAFRDAQIMIVPLSPQTGEPAPRTEPVRMTAKVLNNDGIPFDPGERVLRSGQARTIVFLVPTRPGNYIMQLNVPYRGMILDNGRLEPSDDDPIDAVEQRILHIPAELSNKG